MSLEAIQRLDQQDPLAPLKARFCLPECNAYLCGHSLGPILRDSIPFAAHVIEAQWGAQGVQGWHHAEWLTLPRAIGSQIAPLIGAHPDEVIVADSTSINLFKLLVAALRTCPDRSVILLDKNDFPTDLYIAQSVTELFPHLQIQAVDPEDLLTNLNEKVAVVLLSHVNWRTAACYNLKAISAAAHQVGALTLWDLSHSVGIMPVSLHEADADLAVGCTYKYLNGGPGAPAFIFVANRLQERLKNPLAGWMGHAHPFEFMPDYQSASGVNRFLCGTPPILSLSALHSALSIFNEVSVDAIRQKSRALSALLCTTVLENCAELTLLSPKEADARGGHVAFLHPKAREIFQALEQNQIICDFRPPNLLRFGLAALYVSYNEVWDTAQKLIHLVNHQL